jgi:hypothetical protein
VLTSRLSGEELFHCYILEGEEALSKIRDLSSILEDRRRKEQLKLNTQRVDSLRRVLQCSLCCLRCSMCGAQMESKGNASCGCSAAETFILCPGCKAEFEDYARSLKGEPIEPLFWHNDDWKRFWSTWVSYQEALFSFRKSTRSGGFPDEVNK